MPQCVCPRYPPDHPPDYSPVRPPVSPPVGPRFCGAFTLIELLLVISIMALLLSVLLPVLGRAKQAAKVSICRSNLRQVMMATRMYGVESAETFPQPHQDEDLSTAERASAVWYNAVDRFLGQTDHQYTTSTASRKITAVKQDPVWLDYAGVLSSSEHDSMKTFKMNYYFGDKYDRDGPSGGYNSNDVEWVRLHDIVDTTDTVVYGDGVAYDMEEQLTVITAGWLTSVSQMFHIDNPAYVSNPSILIGLRHDGKANVAFVDGHVTTAEQETKNYFSGAGNGGAFWYDEGVAQQTFKWNPRLQRQ